MINESIGYTYIDAVLALVPLAKIIPSEDGTFSNAEWIDERERPSEEEVQSKLKELQASEPLYFLRKKRNKLLQETDLWGLKDFPTTVEQSQYRETLRNITDNYSSLEEVVWPTKPE